MKFYKIHGGGKVSPAGSVALLNTLYSKVSTGDPHPDDPPKFNETSRTDTV
ncbi:MAG: hypothetical protein K1V97_09015 [Lachnospiraceae bacterium]